jgi:hypothetical protein
MMGKHPDGESDGEPITFLAEFKNLYKCPKNFLPNYARD